MTGKNKPPKQERFVARPEDSVIQGEKNILKLLYLKLPPVLRRFLEKFLKPNIKWVTGFFITAFIGLIVAKFFSPECEWIPIFFREQVFFCSKPIIEGATEQDFVIIFAGVDYKDKNGKAVSADESRTTNVSIEELLKQQLNFEGLNLGKVFIVSPSNSWVGELPTDGNKTDHLKSLADRFKIVDLLMYGEITIDDQNQKSVELKGYIPGTVDSQITSVIQNLSGLYDLGTLKLIEGGNSGDYIDWIMSFRLLTVGLQELHTGDSKTKVLDVFNALSKSSISDLAAIGYINSANIKIDLAKQSQAEEGKACIGGMCRSYTSAVYGKYVEAWNDYIAALDIASKETVKYRTLFGLGNVQFELAKLISSNITDSEDIDQINDDGDYKCSHDLMFVVTDSDPSQQLSKWQRLFVALACYNDALQIAEQSNIPDGSAKINFNVGEAYYLLASYYNRAVLNGGNKLDGKTGEELFLKSSDAFTYIIDNFKLHLMECLTGMAYGERALSNKHIGKIQDAALDFKTAVSLLQSKNCELDNKDASFYKTELAILPIPSSTP